jgi:hypothetical protein
MVTACRMDLEMEEFATIAEAIDYLTSSAVI